MDITFNQSEIDEAQKKNKAFKILFLTPRRKDVYNNFRDVHNDLKDKGFTSELLHILDVVGASNGYKNSILNVNVIGDLNLCIKVNLVNFTFQYAINWKPVLNELRYISNQDVLDVTKDKSFPLENVLNVDSIMEHAAYYTGTYLKLKEISRQNSFVIDEFLNSIVNENVHWDADLTSGEIEKNGIVFNFKIHSSYVETAITTRTHKDTLEVFKQLSENKYKAEK